MDRNEILEMTAERITELMESIYEDTDITKSEVSFSTFLMALVKQFKEFMSLQEMAYGLNSIAAQILCEAAIRDAQNRELYPCPGDMNPENN